MSDGTRRPDSLERSSSLSAEGAQWRDLFLQTHPQERSLRYAALRSAPVGTTVSRANIITF
jgi:hypothetical protein